jgi:hypothetical protein
MSADAAWLSLNAALQDREPKCAGLDDFTADALTDEERAWCASICGSCPVSAECDEYASAAGVTAGFWAGHSWTHHGKQPSGPRPRGGRPKKTPDAEAVTSAPITTKGIES